MSAFICNNFHISVLAHYASKELPRYRQTQPEAIGAILYAENVRSINYRYRENAPTHGFQFDDRARFKNYSALQIIKAAHCLSDQSCKREDWETSEAQAILAAIIDDASHELPGYQPLAWELQP